MVRLITHNMLSCHVKNCNKDNFPLVFKDAEIAIRESEENLNFIRRFLPKLEWNALVTTAQQLGDTSLPEKAPENEEEVTEDLLRKLHHVLMEIHVEEGSMNCRGCGHVYQISSGIPNMLLAEHEVGR